MSPHPVSIREAKAHLDELVAQAARGQEIAIARDGNPIARWVPASRPRRPVDLAQLRALTDAMPRQRQGAARALRRLRVEDRY